MVVSLKKWIKLLEEMYTDESVKAYIPLNSSGVTETGV